MISISVPSPSPSSPSLPLPILPKPFPPLTPSKYRSLFRTSTSSTPALPCPSISLTTSPHGSIILPILRNACSAAHSFANALRGVVRFASPSSYSSESRSFGVSAVYSAVHHPSLNMPTNPRGAPRSRTRCACLPPSRNATPAPHTRGRGTRPCPTDLGLGTRTRRGGRTRGTARVSSPG
ncbi:hypothetical protein CVT25_004268 [Psilocybe cyanescens]|uniref:Uncharacterized protein n=1 Tax=Psilocybe cyanescens TaxID=93625 RepID=A0A409WXJ1_PSICY|nr:hypothetical protein CVT25_004268 [Psilocybe cyanescens]